MNPSKAGTVASRNCVVSGAASGIGAAVRRKLLAQGHTVLGIDVRGAEILADLSRTADRQRAITELLKLSDERIDALVLCAGVAAYQPSTVSVNFFGTVDLLCGLLPALKRSTTPRAVVVSSFAALFEANPAVIQACLDGDEAAALRLSEGDGVKTYVSSKAALTRWCRRIATTREWAGAGVLLNVVSPGIVDTPMMHEKIRDPNYFAALTAQMPLATGRVASPEDIAETLCFLASPANAAIVGQVLYVDGGSEAAVRGDTVW